MRQKIENATAILQRPYTAEMLAGMIEAPLEAVQAELEKLAKAGRVKEVDGVYLTCRPAAQTIGRWCFDQVLAKQMLQVIRKKRITSVRGLAKQVGYSRQYAFLYMEAMASIGLIRWDGESGRYVAKRMVKNKSLQALGTNVKKGILGEMKYGVRHQSESKNA
jgi:DNA-binding transcriptional regulator YhcF (GntR family)